MARQPVKMHSSEESDGVLSKAVGKIGELFAGLKKTNSAVDGIGKRVDAVEKDLAARPTFSPAALKSASEKLDKMSLE
jgi:hypothetical protein